MQGSSNVSAGALIALLPLSRKLGISLLPMLLKMPQRLQGWKLLVFSPKNFRFAIPWAWKSPFLLLPHLAIYSISKKSAFQHLAQDGYTPKSPNLLSPFSILCIVSIIACFIVYLLSVYLLVYLKLRPFQGCLFCCCLCHQLAQILLILK